MSHFYENNPDGLDEPGEIRDAVRAASGDPMDVETEDQALFGWSLLNSWEDAPPDSRADPEVFAAETEFVATELEHEHGVELNDWPDIEDAPDWYDAP